MDIHGGSEMKYIFFLTAFLIAIVAVACDHEDCGRVWGNPGGDEHQHQIDATQISHCHKDGDYPHEHDWRDRR